MDTKAVEICFVAERLRDAGVTVKTVDVGTKDLPAISPDITRETVLNGQLLPDGDDRGQAVTAMGVALGRNPPPNPALKVRRLPPYFQPSDPGLRDTANSAARCSPAGA